jgi:hypothetical protein
MKNCYEAPELTLIGEADEVIQGVGCAGHDGLGLCAPDFEFEED